MLNVFFFSVLIGTVLGFLSGLGAGGGSLLILWLTVILHEDPATARSINLMYFIPAALISCAILHKQGRLQIKKLLPGILAGSSMAGLFTFLGSRWNGAVIQQLFGLLLIVTGIRELFYKPRNR